MERVEIYTSKRKSILLLVGAIIFVALGVWLLLETSEIAISTKRNPVIIKTVGVVAILFFGFMFFIALKMLLRSKVALIIAPEGLNLNPSKKPSQFIKWDDIIGFDEIKIQSTKILIVDVKNPQYWVENEQNLFKRKLMEFNINNYNSPFNISANILTVSSNELKETLYKYFNAYGSK